MWRDARELGRRILPKRVFPVENYERRPRYNLNQPEGTA